MPVLVLPPHCGGGGGVGDYAMYKINEVLDDFLCTNSSSLGFKIIASVKHMAQLLILCFI
jgi:hypothetical protein